MDEKKLLEDLCLRRGFNLSYLYTTYGVYIYSINGVKVSALTPRYKFGLQVAKRDPNSSSFIAMRYIWTSELVCELIIFINSNKKQFNK